MEDNPRIQFRRLGRDVVTQHCVDRTSVWIFVAHYLLGRDKSFGADLDLMHDLGDFGDDGFDFGGDDFGGDDF